MMEKLHDINDISMKIILHAGDGRFLLEKAASEIVNNNFDDAQNYISEAEEKIKQAHIVQTELMQKQISGENVEYSILFAHAQDTLMTINSELRIIQMIFDSQKRMDLRLKKLEGDTSNV